MDVRPGKLAKLAAAPAIVAMMLALVGCQTHVGAAATVGDSTISERTVHSFLNPTIKDITYSTGDSVSPRTFVLQALIREKVLTELLEGNNIPVTGPVLAEAKAEALQGTTEADLVKQVTALGLPADLEPHLLLVQELAGLATAKFTSEADQTAQFAKYGSRVSVSARYGEWDASQLSLAEFGKKQVPGNVTYSVPLPGDAVAPAS